MSCPAACANIGNVRGDAKPSALRLALSLLLYLYVSVRRYLNASWIKLNRWLSHPDFTLVPPSSGAPYADDDKKKAVRFRGLPRPYHKALIVGDGFALGAGDGGVTLGSDAGIIPHLSCALALEPSIRRRWELINRGEWNATTDLWLPPGEDNPPGRLYESVFGPRGPGSDANVAIILAGTADVIAGVDGLPTAALARDVKCLPYPESELSVTARNVRSMARDLQRRGVRVCVVDMPTVGVPGVGRGRLRRLNQQFKQVVKEINEKGSGSRIGDFGEKKQYPVHCISLGNNHRALQPECRSFDSLHLNRYGYKLLALDAFENGGVKAMMVNAEYEEVWKGWLAGRCKGNKECTGNEEKKKLQ